ncbi:MAG: hypothetical protein D6763_04435 [Alphaproteobacteria bacterium]|nr:MAG: hypothetical protein D6763_04435 [Alphaproteobacteria bacterium]
MKQALMEQLVADRAARRAAVVATDLGDGRQCIIYPETGNAEPEAPAPVVEAAQKAARDDTSGVVECAGRRVFLNVFNPALRLMIVGGVHIAQPLAAMARSAGYQVTIIDPRTAFASPERFPGVRLLTEWPDEVLSSIALDSRTAVVTLTHDPKLDDAALREALLSDAFYIGCLGSRKTHDARLERLRGLGLGEAALSRIHGPVGLDIGARSPAEIAVSILAEMTQILRRGARA